jgi:hypothetical protein
MLKIWVLTYDVNNIIGKAIAKFKDLNKNNIFLKGSKKLLCDSSILSQFTFDVSCISCIFIGKFKRFKTLVYNSLLILKREHWNSSE